MNIHILDKLALIDSKVIRGLLVAGAGLLGVCLGFFGFNESHFTEQAARLIDAFSNLLTLAGVAYAAYARIALPNPPLTEGAIQKTMEAVQTGALDTKTVQITPPPTKQEGFVLQALLCVILAVGAVFLFTACTVTTVNTMSQEAKLKAAIEASDSVVQIVDLANRRKIITLEQAQKFSKLAHDERDVLAMAEAVIYSNPKQSRDMLDLAQTSLQALKSFLISQGVPTNE